MGGSVGLKGTDGNVEEARRRGAVPRAKDRARIALSLLSHDKSLDFVTCSGAMGEDALKETGITNTRSCITTRARAVSEYKEGSTTVPESGVDLVLFCGGDGTARDVFDAVGRNVPLLGIPAGVKMYSAVFAIDPVSAADLVCRIRDTISADAEVMDVDEDAYRAGHLKTRLHGIARTPALAGKIQHPSKCLKKTMKNGQKEKSPVFSRDYAPGCALYHRGRDNNRSHCPRLGVKKTLLGVDAVRNRKTVALDIDEKTLWLYLSRGRRQKFSSARSVHRDSFSGGETSRSVPALCDGWGSATSLSLQPRINSGKHRFSMWTPGIRS